MSSMYCNFEPTFLYIKQHKVTGKLYFGKTFRDPEKYKGSGIHWKSHLKKHGKHIDTLWYCLYMDEESIKQAALAFSKLWNIVESEEWLNLIEEDGIDCHRAAGILGAKVIQNRIWVNDGKQEFMIEKSTPIPENFNKGRLKHKAFAGGSGRHLAKGTKWWNNGKVQIMCIVPPDKSYVKGRMDLQESAKQRYSYSPKRCICCENEIPFQRKNRKTCSMECQTKIRKEVASKSRNRKPIHP